MRWARHAAGMGREEVHNGFWWGNLRERDHLKDRHRWEDNIKMDIQEVEWGGGLWTGWIWLRIVTGGGHI